MLPKGHFLVKMFLHAYAFHAQRPHACIRYKSPFQVHNFAVAVSAVKDGRDGKPIELVQQNQHRPKSDRYENALRTNLALLPSPTGENSSLFGNISKSAPIQ